jgi:hypothetical protein
MTISVLVISCLNIIQAGCNSVNMVVCMRYQPRHHYHQNCLAQHKLAFPHQYIWQHRRLLTRVKILTQGCKLASSKTVPYRQISNKKCEMWACRHTVVDVHHWVWSLKRIVRNADSSTEDGGYVMNIIKSSDCVAVVSSSTSLKIMRMYRWLNGRIQRYVYTPYWEFLCGVKYNTQ